MLKFFVKVFRTSFLINQTMDLIYIWYHDIYWSKVFISTINTHDHDLEVEVTDLEFEKCLSFHLSFNTSLFPNFITDLIPLWFDENLHSAILPNPQPPCHVKVNVMDLEFSRNKIYNIRRAILSGDRSCTLSSLSLSFICSTISSICSLPFSWRYHKITHKS